MKIERGVESGGERFSLTLQTKDLVAHSKLQEHPTAVTQILDDAVHRLVRLLLATEAHK